jgi:hypothetical protein
MTVDPANVHELAGIAREIGADVLYLRGLQDLEGFSALHSTL